MDGKNTTTNLLTLGAVLAVFGLLVVLVSLQIIDRYTARILSLAGIYIVISLGLNLISGFTGQLALGHAGFMAIGAYTSAILLLATHAPKTAMNPAFFVMALLAGGAVAALFGLMIGIPALRLRGDYLAIATLGFGEIIRVVLTNLDDGIKGFGVAFLGWNPEEKITIVGGAAGLKGITQYGSGPSQELFGFIWVFGTMIVVLTLLALLIRSRHGRAFLAIREDEIAADAMGVPTSRYKVLAFTVSAFIAGVGGALYAPIQGYMNITDFNFIKSIDFLIIIVLGGMGSLTGTVAAGFFYIILQSLLSFTPPLVKDNKVLFIAMALIAMMLFRPQGLLGTKEFNIRTLLERTFFRTKKGESQ